jgi:hypothetical protein
MPWNILWKLKPKAAKAEHKQCNAILNQHLLLRCDMRPKTFIPLKFIALI